ncbi:hypothetical protein PI124_g20881 [Phytophthora idaei]|nr:hypothetical protein PI125_g22950 [Phytophthora idaei]KAG3234062.1 hypothetical protein PI124_g20881 [Phytophthora idaei]
MLFGSNSSEPLFGDGSRICEGQGGEGRDTQGRQSAAAACVDAIGAAVATGTSPIVEAVTQESKLCAKARHIIVCFLRRKRHKR